MTDRKAKTEMLSGNLERLVLKNFPLWGSEVRLDDGDLFADAERKGRVDYMAIEPKGMSRSVYSIEAGFVHVFEVKSCMADFKSGHGLNRVGDVNWLVMTSELYEQIIDCNADISGWNPLVWGLVPGRFTNSSTRDAYKVSRKMPISQAIWMVLMGSQRRVLRGDAE